MKGAKKQEETLEETYLDWSAKQGRILTDRGNALRYYSEENGFPFSVDVRTHHIRKFCLCFCCNSTFLIAAGTATLLLRAR